MVQTLRRPWQEAASSAFAVASALPVTMNSTQIAELFEQVEHGTTELRCALTAEISALRNANGESLLTVAVRSGNTAVAKQLAQLDPDAIDETDNEGWSALLNAAHCGHVDIVRLLIDNGASVDQPDLMGWSPLMWAVYKNHLDVVDLLVNAKAHVNLIDEEDGLTPLIVASGRGFSQIVERLIDSDCQVNACDKFGSTALIWAARKGHLPVVQLLLNSGAEVDAVGMYSSTALMLATRGNFIQVVELLLTREPNVNVADQNGLTALGMAARDGYADICESLINSGAFVNQCDRFGNWILTSAVRSGNAAIVRMILDKFADINCQDSEKRTPLHLAIDKSFNDIAYILLEKKPNLELKNKDGETPLLRAAKCRHVHLCTYLMSFGAKLAAVDNCGDNALHLALRARSRRLTQALLSNPSDSRLLYRPNKLGQTPYSIDLSNPQPILPLIFGPIDAEDKMDTAMGYDVYSNVLADIVCEPSLSLPLTIGLYAKWGSGKSALLAKLKEAMHSFSRDWLDGVSLSVSFALFFAIFLFFGMFSLTFTMLIAISNSVTAYLISWSVFLLIFIIFCSLIVVVYYGDRKNWYTSMDIANFFARVFSRIRLVYNILTLHAPMNSEDSASMPVSFLFADYHRLSSIGGEQALAKIVATLFEAAETHFGVLPVRLFCCMKPPYPGIHGSLRRHCGVPHVILLIVAVFLLIMAQVFGTVWLLSDRDPNNFNLFIAIAFLCGFVMIAIYPLALIIMYSWTNVPRRRVNAAARNAHKLRFEGLMQKLQTEVDLLADMIRSLDAFTRSHTRLVVVVDGLDNCEQERMVQTLDALELLFSARKHRPFITIIAVDPHVIVSAINHNMHSALSGTELTGHDYLKNIISMPFYLHNSALRQLQSKLREKRESMAEWKERFKRQDTFYGSHLSLREADGRTSRKKSTVPNMNSNSVVGRNMNDGILGEDYFSNMNPRAMRRPPPQQQQWKMSSATSGEYWLISVPGEKGANDAWDKLNRSTGNTSTNSKYLIPDLKVGTLDQLVGLSDDLSKLDTSAEAVIRKLVQYFTEVLEEDKSKIAENLVIGNKDMKTYVTKFQWEGAKYPLKQSLKVLSEIIGKQISQIDNDLKVKSLTYNNLKNALASMDRKTVGSLLTKDLADLVKADDFVLNSEYLQTVIVVVPKISVKEWEQKYATLSSMVVPGSSKLLTEEGEHALYTVTLFKKVIDEFKNTARENKFIVRDFVYDEETLKAGRTERDKLMAEKQRQYAPLIRWLKINFGEIFAAYIHIKALRVFVESVLRYGLPVNFQAAVIEPAKGQQKKLRQELHKLYIHLDGSAAGPIDTLEDSPALMSLGVNEYYPYVFFKLNIDFLNK